MESSAFLVLFREKINELISLNDDEWAVFSKFLKFKKLRKDESFATTGKTCNELGFIITGAVRFCNLVDGKEVTGYFSFENTFVTAIKSYLTGEPCLYDIKALEETIFVTIAKRDMQTMQEHPLLSPKVERLGRLISEGFNILFEDRIKSFVIKTAEERYVDLLETGKDIVNRIPVQYIAQFIGVTPVSLSRIRRRILESAPTSIKTQTL